jgi:tetratricopeptide (TPR) repeat protein
MRDRAVAILVVCLAVGGCATGVKRQAVPPLKPATTAATQPTTSKADLSLDQIEPRPVLADIATRPATTTTTQPSDDDRAPLDAIALFAQARDAMIQGQRYTAINLLEKAIRLDPASYQLRYTLAQVSSGNGMPYDGAIKAYEAAAAIEPDHIEVQSELGRLYLIKSDLPRAIEHLRLAMQTDDYRDDESAAAVVDFYLAKALQQAGYDRAALDAYGSLIDRLQAGGLTTRGSPELAYLVAQPEGLFVQVGELCEKRGLYDDAIKLYRAAIERKDGDFNYQAHLARALLASGQRDEAMRLATELVSRFKASPDSLTLLKQTYRKSGGDAAVARELERIYRERPTDRTLLYALVDVLAGGGKTEQAQKLLTEAARGARYETELVRRLFKLYDGANDINGAARLLVEALAAGPDNTRDLAPLLSQLLRPWRKDHLTVTRLQALDVPPNADAAKQFWVSQLARVYNREQLARSALEQAAKQVPPFAPAYRVLIGSYWNRPDWDDAQRKKASDALIAQVERQGDAELAAELRGSALLNQKLPGEAAKQFAIARDAGGDSPDLRLAYAIALDAAGQGAAAQQVLWKLADEVPTCEDAYLRLFQSYLRQGNANDAIRVLDTWLSNDPSSINAKLLLATVRIQAGQPDLAERILLDLFDREPDNVDVLSALHAYYQQTGKLDQWIARLEEQRAAHPENRAAVEQLVLIYTSQKRNAEATRVLDSVRQAVASDPDLLYYLASLYTRAGQKDVSEQVLEQVVNLDPQHAPACNDLGYAWAEDGKNLARAEALVRVAVQKEPDNQSFLDSLGWVLYKRGRFQQARDALEEAIGSSSLPDPVVLDHLGDVLYRLNLKSDAAAQWKRSQERMGAAAGAAAAGGVQDDDDATAAGSETARLRLQLQQKLKQAESGQPVNVAPVAEGPAKQAKN